LTYRCQKYGECRDDGAREDEGQEDIGALGIGPENVVDVGEFPVADLFFRRR